MPNNKTNKWKVEYDIEYVKRYNFQDFATFLWKQQLSAANWMRGYYFELGNPYPPGYSGEDKTAFILYSGLAYARSKYSPFILISKENKFRAEHKKDVDRTMTDAFIVDVEKVEPGDLYPIRGMVLKTILDSEKRRRKLKRNAKKK